MREIELACQTSVRSGITNLSMTWDKWVEVFTTHQVLESDQNSKSDLNRVKDQAGCFSAGPSSDGRRSETSIGSAQVLALDLDENIQPAIEALCSLFANYEWVLYSTHKAGAAVVNEVERFRLVFPLAEPLVRKDHIRTKRALNRALGGVADSATFDHSRANYFPSTWSANGEYEPFVEHNKGLWLHGEDLWEDGDEVVAETSERRLDSPALTLPSWDVVRCDSMVAKIRRSLSAMYDHPLSPAMKNLVKGEPFASEGKRNDTLLRLVGHLATRFAPLPEEVIEELFSTSIGKMDEPSMVQVVDAYVRMLEKEVQKKDLTDVFKVAEDRIWSEDDLLNVAEMNRLNTTDHLIRQAFVICDNLMWPLDKQYGYGMVKKDGRDALKYLKQELAGVPGVDFTTLTQDGGVRNKRMDEMIDQYAVAANRTHSDMTLKHSYYDRNTKVFYEAVCKWRPIEPRFDRDIDLWLKKMAGNKYGLLLDWLAKLPDLKSLLPVLFLYGKAKAGKSLLAVGLSKIWAQDVTPMKEAMGSFNASILRCPLIFADEALPNVYGVEPTAWIREVISKNARTVADKYRPSWHVSGAVRVMIAGNSPRLLYFTGAPTQHDLEALAERFIFIPVNPHTHDLLEKMPRARIGSWLKEGIAAHALWLHENREVKDTGLRFWVGDSDAVEHTSHLLFGYEMIAKLFEFISAGLQKKTPLRCILLKDGEVYVSPSGIREAWDNYFGDRSTPGQGRLTNAIKAISPDGSNQRIDGRLMRRIDSGLLLQWADEAEACDVKELEAKILDTKS